MPSHTSQFLQPLDVSCFGPVKHEFRVSLSDLQFQIGVEAINKWKLPSVFEFALQRGCSPQNVVAGFIKCGIYGIREDIDHIIGSSIPVAKRTKGNLIDMFFTHAQELIEM